jgi:iron complex outermembrane recepter protein
MRFPFAGAVPALLLSCTLATAAPAADGRSSPGSPDTMIVPLEGIVVTGVRVPEVALKVPAAISVVDRARFGDTRALNLSEALQSVPGVIAQSRSGGADVRVTIRGYGARGSGERSNSGVMRGIRVLTDGIPVTEPDGRTAFDLVDLALADRIEVSRSNASGLYGNASGGVINLLTDLAFDAPWQQYSQQAGAWGFHREQATTGFAIGQGRGVLALGNTTFDGWRAHSQSVATQAHLRFSTPLDNGSRLGVLMDAVSDLNRFPGPLTRDELDLDPRAAYPTFVTRDERRRNRIGRVALTLDRHAEDSHDLSLMVYAEPKYLQRSERGRFRDFNRVHTGGSAVFRLSARPTDALESHLSFGADESYQDGSVLFYNVVNGWRGPDLVANSREGANAAGGFVQEELVWNQRWSARAALRFDDLWYIAEDHMDASLDATKRFTHFTPKGSLAFLGHAYTIYASLGGGVEAPAFNEIDPPPTIETSAINPFLDPMLSTTYEVGAKGGARLPGRLGRLRYDAALYWIDIAHEIIPYDGGAYFFTAGKSQRKGAELGLDWLPLERLLVSLTGTLSDNRYLEYANQLGDFSGGRVAGLPRATLSGLVRWTASFGLSTEVSVEHLGSYYADDANAARTDAYTLLGASLGWTRSLGDLSARAFVAGTNLTDQNYSASVFINGINGRFYEPGLPRAWSAGVTLRRR